MALTDVKTEAALHTLITKVPTLPDHFGKEAHDFMLLLCINNEEHDDLRRDFPTDVKKQMLVAFLKWIGNDFDAIKEKMKTDLRNALSEVDRSDLIDLVKDGNFADKNFIELASELGMEWEDLMTNLGIKKAIIDQMKMDWPGMNVTVIASKILCKWRDMEISKSHCIETALKNRSTDSSDRLDKLLTALKKTGRLDIVADVNNTYDTIFSQLQDLRNGSEETPPKKRRLSDTETPNSMLKKVKTMESNRTEINAGSNSEEKTITPNEGNSKQFVQMNNTLHEKKDQINHTTVEDSENDSNTNVLYDINAQEDDSVMKGPVKELKLRNYQKELAEPALRGENVIIFAPTNTGKTFVAMKIVKEHFVICTESVRKVVVIVPQTALANQHFTQFKKHLNLRVKSITGETAPTEKEQQISEWMKNKDVLILTVQLLMNALVSKDVKITDFSLLVFDECHHTHDRHVYNQIMSHYTDAYFESQDQDSFPQIVGLTASLGVGKANNLESAKKWVKTIMANLDVRNIVDVEEHIEELRQHAKSAIMQSITVESREKDYFGDKLRSILDEIGQIMKKSPHSDIFTDRVLRPPVFKGSDQYTQWLSALEENIVQLDDAKSDARIFFLTCKEFLDIYHKALLIHEDCRKKDALTFIDEKFEQLKKGPNLYDTSSKLLDLYLKEKDFLRKSMDDPLQENPKLVGLKDVLLKKQTGDTNTRCIVIAKTRDIVRAIESWILDSKDLAHLRPVMFVGTNASAEKGGMTKYEQTNALQLFRDGTKNILIATSVVEEGLDIEDCNLVIRYNYVTNETAMTQSKGRARAPGSMYVVVSGQRGTAVEKDELNLIRESMMLLAINEVKSLLKAEPNQFKAEQRGIQKEASRKREIETRKKNTKKISEETFELKCLKCSTLICTTLDIRAIETYKAIVNPEVISRLRIEGNLTGQKQFGDVTCDTGKIYCKTCGCHLGNVSKFNDIHFPVIKIAKFTVSFSNDKGAVQNKRYKRMKDVPFSVLPIEQTDEDRMMGIVNI